VIHRIRFIAAAGFSLFLEQYAFAQWIDYKTPGLPRGADGRVNMTAPRPVTADGKPDLSGLWRFEAKVDVAAAVEAAGPQPWIVDAAKKYAHELGRNDTDTQCLPAGPRAMSGQGYTRLLHTPTILAMMTEGLVNRQIHMDGRSLPTDPNPTWMGYSVARWEGDTLVVTSNGFNDRTFLDFVGHGHSEALRVTERFTRRTLGHMDVQVTWEDSKAYSKPITFPVEGTLLTDTEMLEYVCNENERSRPHLVGTADDDKKQEVTVDAAILASYAGTYQFPPLIPGDPSFKVTVTPKDNTLLLALERGPTMTAVPTSRTKFLAMGVAVEFLPGPSGVVNEMVVTIVEGELKGVRVK